MIAALDAGLAQLYPPEQRFGPNLKAQHLEAGRGTFLIARDNGRAVGSGAIRLLETTTAEVKRMYVEPDQRGRAGFTEIECWGEYLTSPSSVCMEKVF